MKIKLKNRTGCLSCTGCLFLVGLGTIIFFLLALAGLTMDEKPTGVGLWIFVLVCLAGGCGLVYWGVVRHRIVLRRNYLADVVINQRHRSLGSIDRLFPKLTLDQVRHELQMAINQGYIEGFSLDPVTDRLVDLKEEQLSKPQEPRRFSFKCELCGAGNEVWAKPGRPISCQYCGAPWVEK